MTPEQYCYEKASPPGTTLYYSLRHFSKKQRDAIVAIFAFYYEIEDITLMYEDFNTARIKLNWWRDEIISIQDGARPHHLVAVFLQQTGINPSSLIDLIQGLEENLTAPIFSTFEDVVIHIMRTVGKREKAIAEILNLDFDSKSDVFQQIIFIIDMVHYIQHLHRYVKHNLVCFSQDELQKFHIGENDFKEFVTTPNIRELLQYQAEKIHRAYQNIKHEQIPPELRYQLIRCKIAMATLKVIQKSDFKVLENYIDITPLKKWWIAWRG